jgi:hypothetical protein
MIPGTKEHAVEKGKELAARELIDPGSAQFRDVVAFKAGPSSTGFAPPGSWTVCGEINGKNRLGGYVGFAKFAANIGTGEVMLQASEPGALASSDDIAAAGYNNIALDLITSTNCSTLSRY